VNSLKSFLVLTLDVMDVAGEHQSDITHSVYKVQLSPDGTEIRREKSQSKQQLILEYMR
jgi:hypothetical protein